MSKTRTQPRQLPASYVVRLYRADPARLDAVAGLIEDVGAGATTSFRNGTELLCRLQGVEVSSHEATATSAQATTASDSPHLPQTKEIDK